MRKWSITEFEGLIHHQLTDAQGPMELVEGLIVPLPSGEQIKQQVTLLTQSIERNLIEQGLDMFEVRSHHPFHIDDYSIIKPAIALFKHSSSHILCLWALDISETDTNHDTRAALYAQFPIQEYWHLSVEPVELRIKTAPHNQVYQQQRLLMVGEQASLQPLPNLKFSLQEPLPRYYLTRTLQGQRTYIGEGVPLQIV